MVQILLDPLEGTVDQIFVFPCFANKLVEALGEYGEIALVCFPKDLVPIGLFGKVVDHLSKVGDASLGCRGSGLKSALKFLKHLKDLLHRRSSS